MSVSRSLFVLVLSFFFLSSFVGVNAGELPMAKPEEVGLSIERLARLDETMQRYVDDEKLAGVLTLVARRGAATTYVIIDPAEKMISLLMVQYWPLCIPLYGQFQTLVYQSIVD